MADPTNTEIATALDELGDLYELDGAIIHRIVAYRNAAKAVRDATVSVVGPGAPGAGHRDSRHRRDDPGEGLALADDGVIPARPSSGRNSRPV